MFTTSFLQCCSESELIIFKYEHVESVLIFVLKVFVRTKT